MNARQRGIARLYAWLVARLSAPNAQTHILLLSLGLMAFSLDTDLGADDYLHELILRGANFGSFAGHPSLDIFRFCDPRLYPGFLREGVFTWWDDPNARLSFMRPVSALTHYVDYMLFPDAPWAMHLHSLLWGGVVLLGVRALFRTLIADRFVATLALALYALDDARGWFVSWVAARNGVVATAFSVWALVLHVRHRKGESQVGAVLAPALLAIGLLSGEGAVAAYAYLLGYALFLERGPLSSRALRLWPYALVFVGWRLAYRALEYGASGSDLYVDPSHDPLTFIARVIERGPVLLSAQLGGMWSDVWTSFFAFPRLRIAVYAASVLLVLLAALLYAPLWRKDALQRTWLLSALLAVVPACAVFPADRLLTWVALGASATMAAFLAPVLKGEPAAVGGGWSARLIAPVALGFVISNLIVAPPLVASRSRGNIALRDVLGRADRSVPSDPSITDKMVVFVNPPAVPIAAYIPIARAALGTPRAKAQRTLATSTSELRVERLSADTLRLSPAGGFLQNPSSKLMWTPEFRFSAGQRVSLDGDPVVEIERVDEGGRPLVVRAHFARPLEDGAYVWRQWLGAQYEPFTPPAIGQSVVLPSADYMQVVFGVPLPVEARYEPPKP